jgi:hypothetical protein
LHPLDYATLPSRTGPFIPLALFPAFSHAFSRNSATPRPGIALDAWRAPRSAGQNRIGPSRGGDGVVMAADRETGMGFTVFLGKSTTITRT